MTDSKDEKPADMKQKFREALDRKNKRDKKGVAHEDFTMSKHDSRPDGRKRQFRRKTG